MLYYTVNELIININVLYKNKAFFDLFTNKVILDVNILCINIILKVFN